MSLATLDSEVRMACMEVWGGSEAVNAAVTLSGLDAWIYSRPYGENAEAGGDVYYVSACATGRINRLLVADVSGHGHGVRPIAVALRDLMRQFVNYLDQGKFVSAMNRQFIESSENSVFATAVVTTFFAPTRTLSVCNAGHPPPLIYRSATKRWSYLESTGESMPESTLESAGESTAESRQAGNIPLGIMEMDAYEQFDVELDVGDLVLVYTDALMEASDSTAQMLGLPGLLEVVSAAADPAEPQNVVSRVLDRIDQQTHGGLRADDVTALVIRPNGTGVKMAMRDRLLAPLRVVKGIGSFLRGNGPAGLPELSLVNIGGAMFGSLNEFWRRRRLPRHANASRGGDRVS